MDATALPAWSGKREAPATMTRPLPADAIRGGTVELAFRREGGSNAVVSELWIVERAKGTGGSAPPAPAAVAAPPAVKANPGAGRRVLIVTGRDYPGHPWQKTTPILVEAIGKDARLEVSVTEDAGFLAAPDLARYHALVLN